LNLAATQSRNDEACNDGGEQARFGLEARCNGKGHGQRQSHHTHCDAGRNIGAQLLACVAL